MEACSVCKTIGDGSGSKNCIFCMSLYVASLEERILVLETEVAGLKAQMDFDRHERRYDNMDE